MNVKFSPISLLCNTTMLTLISITATRCFALGIPVWAAVPRTIAAFPAGMIGAASLLTLADHSAITIAIVMLISSGVPWFTHERGTTGITLHLYAFVKWVCSTCLAFHPFTTATPSAKMVLGLLAGSSGHLGEFYAAILADDGKGLGLTNANAFLRTVFTAFVYFVFTGKKLLLALSTGELLRVFLPSHILILLIRILMLFGVGKVGHQATNFSTRLAKPCLSLNNYTTVGVFWL